MSDEHQIRKSEQSEAKAPARAASGIDPKTGEWTPAFPGQRPPLPVKHGAQSERRLRVRRIESRDRVRELGIREEELDAVGQLKLRNWQRADAPLLELEDFAAEHGFLDDWGEPRGFTRLYFVAVNSERRAIHALEQHVLERRKHAELDDYVAATYGEAGDGDG